MTKSAKRDTVKAPAEPAVTEPAAREPAVTEPAATGGEVVPEPEETAEPEADAGAVKAGDSAGSDLEDTKRKFREALERKHQARGDGQSRGGRNGGKISGAHGPAASRRNFRRKSG